LSGASAAHELQPVSGPSTVPRGTATIPFAIPSCRTTRSPQQLERFEVDDRGEHIDRIGVGVLRASITTSANRSNAIVGVQPRSAIKMPS
jgi:hypothetical protein